jgi:hypothetical protein
LIQLILFLSVGALLLVSLLLFARRGSGAEGAGEVLVEAQQALKTLQRGLLPAPIVLRIFATEDWAYLKRTAPASVQELFGRERRRIALAWVRHVRMQVLSLQRFHRSTARFYSQLNMRTEMELAFNFMTLMLTCRALQAILYLRGSYAAPRLVEATAAAAARICAISEKALAFMTPQRLGTFDKQSIGPAV